jgi:hypothetical protein
MRELTFMGAPDWIARCAPALEVYPAT